MASKPKRKKRPVDHGSRARALVKGLIIGWTDDTPLKDNDAIANEHVSHKNPVIRPMAMSAWNTYGDWLTNVPILLWRVDITIVFRYPNGREQHEHRRVVHRHRLHDIAEACEPAIESALKFGCNPIEIRFLVECLGDRAATEVDYDDFKEKAA